MTTRPVVDPATCSRRYLDEFVDLASRLRGTYVGIRKICEPAVEISYWERIMMIESLTGTHADWIVAIARIVLAIIFFAHGAQKMLSGMAGPALPTACASRGIVRWNWLGFAKTLCDTLFGPM
jgi:hypothetical protein